MGATTELPRVALIVDHPDRDLPGLVLTALELCRRGMVVHLVPLNLQARELWALSPDLVVLNYARPGNDGLARELLDAGIQVGVLDTEGGAWEDCGAYSAQWWTDGSLRSRLAFACMWGPRLADHMVETGLLASEQVAITGCPRFDFYAPDWRPVFGNGEQVHRPLLLINTNFSYGNPRFATAARNRDRLVRELRLGAEHVDAYLAAEAQALDGMVELARHLARDFPGCEVLLRPHPFEDPARYRAALGPTAAVAVDETGPVQRQIFRAAAVIQRSCSTAIEAALAGVPALSPQWVPAPAVVAPAESVSLPSRSYAELRHQVQAILDSDTPPPPPGAVEGIVADWFYRCDGRSHQRVADVVERHVPTARRVNVHRCRERLYRAGLQQARFPSRAAAVLRQHLRLAPDLAFRPGPTAREQWQRSDKCFDAAGVRSFVTALQRTGAAARNWGETDVTPARQAYPPARYTCGSVTVSPA